MAHLEKWAIVYDHSFGNRPLLVAIPARPGTVAEYPEADDGYCMWHGRHRSGHSLLIELPLQPSASTHGRADGGSQAYGQTGPG